MRKLFLIAFIFAVILCTGNIGHTNDFAAITKNTEIAAALNALQGIGKTDVISILQGRNATGHPIRVMFRDLSIYGASDCEALTTKTQSGKVVIYINAENKGAPTEAITCLIDKEYQNHKMTNTNAEETGAWIKKVST